MIQILTRRITHLIPLLMITSLVVFWVTNILPGDPTTSILGDYGTTQDREALRHQLGLDQPLLLRYGEWLLRTISGDLGQSITTHQSVLSMLLQRIPVTLELAVLAVALSIIVGVPMGILAALWRNSWVDTLLSAISLSGMAIPYFWVGLLLIMFLSVKLGWLPPSGYTPFFGDPLSNLRLMILPVLTTGIAEVALVMRQMRASMLQVLSQDFIRTARAKGAGEIRVVFGHALRNSIIPVATIIGLQFGTLIGGTVVVESIFSLPGLGRMIVEAISERDYPVIQGAFLMVVLGVIIVNLITDLSYSLIDRRVKP
ncbi:MAG: ABC transporter permease [Rhizobiaceae bacterium]|nr:ABC transporter permease [Rhizobiaceae bacterium]